MPKSLNDILHVYTDNSLSSIVLPIDTIVGMNEINEINSIDFIIKIDANETHNIIDKTLIPNNKKYWAIQLSALCLHFLINDTLINCRGIDGLLNHFVFRCNYGNVDITDDEFSMFIQSCIQIIHTITPSNKNLYPSNPIIPPPSCFNNLAQKMILLPPMFNMDNREWNSLLYNIFSFIKESIHKREK